MRGRRFCICILFILSISASGQVPHLINYQGRLLNGTNLVNGNVGLSLRLFNVPSGGSSLYVDSNSVAVADGLYSTFIGDNPTNVSFLTALTNAKVYVEVAVNGLTLSPRERLASVGYSLATRGLLVTTNNSVVVSPSENSIDPSAAHSTIGGGEGNSIQTYAEDSFLGGGFSNSMQLSTYYSFLGSGNGNCIETGAHESVLGGGIGNIIQVDAFNSVLGGGVLNRVGATQSFLGGGYGNSIQANSDATVLAGGYGNSIQQDALCAFLGGGQGNSIQASSLMSVLGGGFSNIIQFSVGTSVLAGGNENSIQDFSHNCFIGGGYHNSIGTFAQWSVIPGGFENAIGNGAQIAFAAGSRAKANHNGAFVWGDSSVAGDFASTADNQFLIRAAGGVGIGTPNPASELHVKSPSAEAEISIESGDAGGHRWTMQSSGFGFSPTVDASFQIIDRTVFPAAARMLITTNGNVGIGTTSPTSKLEVAGTITCVTLNQTSDRNAKENFAAVDANDVLEKIAALPLTRWNFKTEPGVQHLGPMAQDFRAAFGLGQNDTTIATVDESGVALAAIQELKKANDALRAQNEDMLERLERLEEQQSRTE